jgi:hypothetical protein
VKRRGVGVSGFREELFAPAAAGMAPDDRCAVRIMNKKAIKHRAKDMAHQGKRKRIPGDVSVQEVSASHGLAFHAPNHEEAGLKRKICFPRGSCGGRRKGK